MREEWGYGSLEDVSCSGVRVIGGSRSVPSGMHEDDTFGSSVAVKDDLTEVGSPRHSVDEDGENYLADAGAVFLYRRDDPANGGDKAGWAFESKVPLPS